jgi:hypothetical protein
LQIRFQKIANARVTQVIQPDVQWQGMHSAQNKK